MPDCVHVALTMWTLCRLKRVQAAQKLRDKRRKDEALAFQAKANIRVRQRTQVHVQGMTTKIANEDVSLRSRMFDLGQI